MYVIALRPEAKGHGAHSIYDLNRIIHHFNMKFS